MKNLLSVVTILVLSSVGSIAAGTTVGTNVKNTATLSFKVSGVTQADVTSNEDSFVVDKKIDMLLTHDDDPKHVIVVANKQDEQRSFTLTNESNDEQKFSLAVSNLNGETYDSKKDSADMQNLEISIDGGSNWSAGPIQTDILDADENLTVLVRGDVADSALDGEVMNIQLEATAVKDDGSVETSTTDADDKDEVDIVLGEGAGVTDFDNTPFDGKFSAWGGYLVNTPNVDLTKLSCVYTDTVTSDDTLAKRIPGATVVYVFDLNNTSDSTDATDITLSDSLSTNYDLTDTVASAKSAEDKTTACSCTYGDAEGGNGGSDISANASLSGSDLTLSSLKVSKNSHTCVSIQVKIK